VPVEVTDEWLDELKAQVGELPQARRRRYAEALGLTERDAAILAADRETGDFFEQVLAAGAEPKRATTLMEALREMSNERGAAVPKLGVAPRRVAEVAALVSSNALAASKETAKAVLSAMAESDAPAAQVAAGLGLVQVSDTAAIDAAIDALVAQNPRPLQDYRAGKQAALGALVGMVMKAGKGLNPKVVQERLREKLGR
jgi:aspartyl-tRNA(Asn)/glutamyl-tRNA(Gln) amidotransferase subunit B